MTREILKYSKAIIWVHWITLVFATGQLVTGKMIQGSESSGQKILLFRFHVVFGIFVLLLTAIRVRLFFKGPRPAKPQQLNPLHKKFIKIIHVAFYIVLLLLGLTGLFSMAIGKTYWDALITHSLLPDGHESGVLISHFALTKVFMLLFILHIVGFVWHWIRFKDNRLRRIS